MTEEAYAELRSRLAEIADLGKVAGLLFWDQRTMMPAGGAPARAEQLGTLARIAHERLTSEEIGRLLEELRPYEKSLEYDSDEASLIRVTRRDYEKARRVPPELGSEIARAASAALPVWDQARKSSDFALFLPCLARNVELRRRYIACFEPSDEDYDVVLDDYEPGMKTAEVRNVFETLKDELIPLIGEIAEREQIDDSCLSGEFPVEAQRAFELRVLEAFGFAEDEWRLDETLHPFASNGSRGDIRLTTRHRPRDLDALFATMHEFGHGLYEHCVAESLERTPLARGASLGIHESQSRMWENLVGRSRHFWSCFYPALRETFSERFQAVELETFYRAINKVEPSLIRIEADEATYNLHVILRFELEQAMLAGDVALADLPEAWNARMKDFLGIDVPDVADGVLQDMHWAGGYIGYFPTYALGNLISVQIWERARKDLPDLEERLAGGDFAPLREWLCEHVHRHGRKFRPPELLERVVGGPLDPQPYLRYLRRKLGEIYELPADRT